MKETMAKNRKRRDTAVMVLLAALAVAGVCRAFHLPLPEEAFTPEQLLGMQCLRQNLYALVFFIFCVLCAGGAVVLNYEFRAVLPERFRYQMWTLAALMVDAGVWVLTDSELLKLAVRRTNIVAFFSLLSFGLLVPLTLEFVGCALHDAHPWMQRVQKSALLLLTLDAVGWMAGWFTMFWLIPLLHLTVIAGVVTALHATLREYRQEKRRELRDILWGFAMMAVFGILSMVSFYWTYYHNRTRVYAVFYCIGILCFLLCLACAAIRRLKQNFDEWMKLENYKTLAYRDALTGLANYTAFQYEKARWDEQTDWVCIMMDVNWLKQTNDRHGHIAGDALLCGAARCIQEAFFRAAGCYRIGGDEFVALAHGVDRTRVETAIWNLNRICANWNQTAEYPVSIAVGYAMQMGRKMTAEELLAEADAAMYANKAEIKKAAAAKPN